MKHVMIDIETMGTDRATAPLLSIGAVPFNPSTAEIAPPSSWFYSGTSLRANVDAGRVIDPSTVEWWLNQAEQAQFELMSCPRTESLHGLVVAFRAWIEKTFTDPRKVKVWAKPPQFDLAILQSCFEQCTVHWPFYGKNERDLRVLIDLGKAIGLKRLEWPDNLTPHRADHDAAFQARQTIAVWLEVTK